MLSLSIIITTVIIINILVLSCITLSGRITRNEEQLHSLQPIMGSQAENAQISNNQIA